MRTTLVLTFLFGAACSTLVPFKRLSETENDELQKSCGIMKTPLDASDSSRVLDGDVVTPGYADWVVRIERNLKMQCTGALISARHVLTASHCEIDPTRHTVWAGRHCAKQSCTHDMEKFKIRAVVGIPQNDHRDDQGFFTGPDLVLLELDREVTNSTGSPACLWNPKQDLPDEPTLLAAGWGNDARGSPFDNDFTWSKQTFSKSVESMIVSRAEEGHQAAGSGDSGSGLIMVHQNRVYNLGPLSNGPFDETIEEGIEEPVSYYTRASDHVNFICHFTGVCVEGATAEGDYIEGEDFLVCESASNCPTGLEESSAEYSDEDSDSNYDSDTFEYERKSFDESY